MGSFRGSLCVEMTAESLRGHLPWQRWVETIRSYAASTPGAPGRDAKILADAMWHHGCAFGANVTAQNVTWGSCLLDPKMNHTHLVLDKAIHMS